MIAAEIERIADVVSAREIIQDHSAARVYEHWLAVKKHGIGPNRAAIDPTDLFDYLSNLTMIKPAGVGGDFAFSLIGTGLARLYGLATGNTLSEAKMPEATKLLLQEALMLCADRKQPVRAYWHGVTAARGVLTNVEVVLLPVSEDGSTISRILGYHAFVDPAR